MLARHLGEDVCTDLPTTRRPASRERLLPIGLSHGARMLRPMPEDGLVHLDDVSLDRPAALFGLWEERQRLVV